MPPKTPSRRPASPRQAERPCRVPALMQVTTSSAAAAGDDLGFRARDRSRSGSSRAGETRRTACAGRCRRSSLPFTRISYHEGEEKQAGSFASFFTSAACRPQRETISASMPRFRRPGEEPGAMILYVPSTFGREERIVGPGDDAVGEFPVVEHGPAAGDAPHDVETAPLAGIGIHRRLRFSEICRGIRQAGPTRRTGAPARSRPPARGQAVPRQRPCCSAPIRAPESKKLQLCHTARVRCSAGS